MPRVITLRGGPLIGNAMKNKQSPKHGPAAMPASLNLTVKLDARQSELITGLGMAYGVPPEALAQGSAGSPKYPERPITVIVPYAPGSGMDAMSRIISQELGDRLKQSILIDNKAGAGGTIAAEFVAKSPPDGYTLLMAFDSHAVNPHVYKNLRYQTFDDFAPVTFVGSIPLLFVANQNLAAQDIPSLVRLAKGGQVKLSYGSVGAGSSGHLAAEHFSQLAGISMLHVPFKGGAPAMTALMGDQVQLVIFAATAAVPLVASGKVKALAISGAKRSPALPGVPTMAEAGFAPINSGAWMGLLAPAGTPAAVVQKLNQEVAKALADPELNRKLGELAIQLAGSTPEELGQFIRSEHDKWGKLIKDVKLNLEQ